MSWATAIVLIVAMTFAIPLMATQMSWATAIVLIVAMTFAIPLMALARDRNFLRRSGSSDPIDEARVASVEAELAALRERMETVERILTDERHDLEREFERLESAR